MSENKKMTVNEIIPIWIEDKRFYVKRSSISAYSLLIQNHIEPYFGEMNEVTENDAQKFVHSKIDSGLSQKTIKDILIVLVMILKFGCKKKYISYKPWDIRYPTDHTKREIKTLNRDQHKLVIEHIKENLTFRNLGIMICLSTGMRIGEICGITWGDIDIENRIITVNKTVQRIYNRDENGVGLTELIVDTPKTLTSNREIPMTKDLIDIFSPLKSIMNDNFYVLTNNIKPTEPRTYRGYYMEFMENLGLPKINFHGLRHTFATRCVESGADVKTISVILGHANVSTTLNLYVHPNFEQKESTIHNVFDNL